MAFAEAIESMEGLVSVVRLSMAMLWSEVRERKLGGVTTPSNHVEEMQLYRVMKAIRSSLSSIEKNFGDVELQLWKWNPRHALATLLGPLRTEDV
jgi:hypothetical protein